MSEAEREKVPVSRSHCDKGIGKSSDSAHL